MQHFVGVAGNFRKESREVEIMQHAVSLLLRSSHALYCRNSATKKLRRNFPAELVLSWSRLPDSDRGPHPYHGCALPTELSRLTKNKWW